jgi:1-acyl-sn-glycerol-3-phosphate acyltransferase
VTTISEGAPSFSAGGRPIAAQPGTGTLRNVGTPDPTPATGNRTHLRAVPRTGGATPVDAGPTDDRRPDVDGWGRSESFRALTRRHYDPINRYWLRAEWEGIEHIPLDGGALLVANHGGAIPSDAPVIMHGIETELARAVYGLAENLFRRVPVVGTLWSRAGGVPAHPDNAYRLLHDEQQLVLVFPEGTKATGKLVGERYQLRRFGRGGFVEIAMRAGVPVIPIAVVGNEEAMPILWKSDRLAKLLGIPYAPITANQFVFGPVLGYVAPLPAKIKVRVLPPVRFDVEPGAERYNRGAVLDESERVRGMIQHELDDMLRSRRSVWRG